MNQGIKTCSKKYESRAEAEYPYVFNPDEKATGNSEEGTSEPTNWEDCEEFLHDEEINKIPPVHKTIPPSQKSQRTQQQRKDRKRNAWEDDLEQLQEALIVEMYGSADICSQSGCMQDATHRCVDCDPKIYYCAEHLTDNHQSPRHRLHLTQQLTHDQLLNARKWVTLEHPLWGTAVDVRCKGCTSSYEERTINFINRNGQQVRKLSYCCQTLAAALISVGFFPATPSRPVTSFCIDLLKDYRSLNLICKVNQSTYAKHIVRISHTRYQNTEVEVYRSMQGCYRAFSYIYGQMIKGRSVKESSRVECPCCTFKKDTVAAVTFDVCFGCTGKQIQAQNPVKPFHDEAYVLQDLTETEVLSDIHLKVNAPKINSKRTLHGDCELRATEYTGSSSSSYYKGLKFTGLMGGICKHSFPWFFMNVMYGKEKLVFASRVWEHIRNKYPGRKWNAKYDIMCVFEKYLSERGRPIPDFTGIPAGHSKFHRWLCQELWGPLFVKGMGLSVGEEIEVLWRDLMQIWSRLKEMSPENRVDELTEHLLHLAEECMFTIHEKLVNFADRAEKTLRQANEAILQSSCGLTEANVDEWYSHYSASLTVVSKETQPWQEVYAGYLYDLYNKRWVLDQQYRKGVTMRSISQLKRLIDVTEKQKNVSARWLPDSTLYQQWTRKAWERDLEYWRKKIVAADNDQFFYVETNRHQKLGRKGYKKRIEAAKLISKSSVARERALDQWNDYHQRLFPLSSKVTLEQFTSKG
jgi:hypothetical protein